MKLSRILILLMCMLCLLSSSALASKVEEAENTVAYIQNFPVFDPDYEKIDIDDLIIAILYKTYYSTGTGFAVGKTEGEVEYFVTNYHVVNAETITADYILCDRKTGNPLTDENGQYITEQLEVPAKGTEYYVVFDDIKTRIEATYVARSDRADLAVLKLSKPTDKRDPSILRPYDTLEKQDVFPLGFPGVAEAIFQDAEAYLHVQSTKGRINSFYTHEESGRGDLFSMDAPINHGNSGGPVVDKNGCVVGVSVSGSEGYDFNVAISVNEVVRMLDDLNIPYLTVSDAGLNPTYIAIGAGAVVFLLLLLALRKKKPAPDPSPKQEDEKNNVVITDDKKKDVVITADDRKPVKPEHNPDRNARVLVGQAGVLHGRRITLAESNTIGRDSSCTIALPDDTHGVSGKHCSISCVDGVVTVTDLGSQYGTWIDNVKLIPGQGVVMHRGHNLYLGSKQQAFVLNSGANAGIVFPPVNVPKRSLVCDTGALQGQRFSLSASTTIGRDPSCSIVLPQDTQGVSGRHCSVSFVNGVVTVTDLGSRYGTWIDNVKLTPGQGVVMHRGHHLYLGSKKQAFTLHS